MSDEQKQENQEPSSETSPEPEKEIFDPETATQEDWLALVAQKDEEIRESQDRVMRIAAESENTRKRLERDREEKVCFANESLIQAILPVLDNLERAVQHAETNTNVESLLEGVRMTLKGFTDSLNRFGCVSFESVGELFDPNYHEAMMQEENPDQPDNTVLQELEKGYLLKERLLRPAKVIVSKSPPTSSTEESGEGAPQSESSAEKE